MKKTTDRNPTTPSKKLRLTRTTVRPLTTTELTAVAGARPPKGSQGENPECQTVGP